MGMLTRDQERVARQLDLKGRLPLRLALQQGIEEKTLDAVVEAGRAVRIDGPDPIYESTNTGPGGQRHHAGQMRDPRSSRLEQPPDGEKRVLNAAEERVARWLDRVGSTTLRQARVAGIEPRVLDALVEAGRAELIGDLEPVYRTTLDPGVVPDTAPAPAVEPTPEPEHTVVTHVQLTPQQERAARWLMRAGQCSKRMADERGITPELDAVVAAGRAVLYVIEDGAEPIYRYRQRSAGWKPEPSAPGPPKPPAPEPTAPIAERVLALLADGEARTPGGIVGPLLRESSNFIEARETSRDVQRVLPLLASRGVLHRLMIGVPTEPGRPPRYEERYVDASTVVPVCQICFGNHWGVQAVPPQSSGHQIALCAICGQRANDPSFLSKTEVAGILQS